MDSLYVGRRVDIQRTNGRIHSAVISSINWSAQNVTVEWAEADETKGKEVDFGALYDLNPEAFHHSNPVSAPSAPVPRRIPAPRSTEIPAAIQNQASLVNRASLRVRASNMRQSVAGEVTTVLPSVTSVTPVISSSVNNNNNLNGTTNNNNNNNNNNNSNGVMVNSVNKMPRKSCILREVDKIKKQREERRNRQAEQKAEKMELMSAIEPGNPNWEFLGMIREYRATLDMKPLTASDLLEIRSDQICVAVRKRPMNNRELHKKDIDVLTVPNKDMVVVHEPKSKVDLTRYLENHMFRFDYAFDETADNILVYQYTAKPLVTTVFEGGMATCFAYGQTGSGKTHTMGGDFHGKSQDSTKGIYALVAQDIFRLQQSPKYRNQGFSVVASYFEIYSGKVFDLLNNKAKLRVLEDAKQQVRVVGLQEHNVETVNDVLRLIQTGNSLRTSGVTSANNHSSRSHAVFQLMLKKPNKRLHGKFSLIDLAGNERGADTASANRQTRMEGAEINKSLLALKECIRALGRKGAHLPFRVSKLTQVLRDSFIGENSRTCMIAMISPGMQSCENTLNTLRYADRVKELGAENLDVKNDDDCGLLDNGNGDDLALLHNAHQMPDELYTFHEAVSLLQESEEAILDSHKALVDEMPKWIDKHERLIQMTLAVDYDVDTYAQEFEKLLDENLEILSKIREDVSNFRSQLAEEELISQKIHK